MARSWCMCAGCNRVLFQDTALWKSDKPYCEECSPKGAKRPEVEPEPVDEEAYLDELSTLIGGGPMEDEQPAPGVDEQLNDSCTGG